MNTNPLRQQALQAFIQEMAVSMSSIFGLDVTVVDDSLVRVAGTGTYEDRIGERLPSTSAFDRVIRTGLPQVVEHPKDCAGCEDIARCRELCHLAYPLGTGGRRFGLLSLVAFNQTQRQQLLARQKECLKFLKHMARLFTIAAQSEANSQQLAEATDRLYGIVEAIREGILAVDKDGKIICCNSAAAKILRFDGQDVVGRRLEELLPEAPVLGILKTGSGYVNREVVLRQARGNLRVVTTGCPLFSQGHVVGAVALLKDLQEARQMAYDLSDRQPERPIDHILGHDPALQEAKQMALRAAAGNSTVLLLGESGTGKELFARALHFHSPRSKNPFVVVNCAALPEELLESELFGYEEGAFTGARRGGKPGKFELANGGTLFLDEVADCSLRLQSKLLRALDQKEIERVGGTQSLIVDVRVVAATNRDLVEMVRQREFREDLYYRLSVIPIHIPPLRERGEDLPLVLQAMLERYARSMGRPVPRLTAPAERILRRYSWPGNVRELENVVQYLLHSCDGQLVGPADLPPRVQETAPPARSGRRQPSERASMSRSEWERTAIAAGLARLGNTPAAKEALAREIGLSRATIYRKIKRYGLGDAVGGGER